MTSALELTSEQVLAFRRRVGAVDQRLATGTSSLRRAAWAGLQDSMPRAALLSIHARVREATPTVWADESLVQVWGPRFSAYVVPVQDRAVFTLGRLPVDPARRRFAEDLADRLEKCWADDDCHTATRAGPSASTPTSCGMPPPPDASCSGGRGPAVRRCGRCHGLTPIPTRPAWSWRDAWPGAVLVDGQVVGTWRRAAHRVAVTLWTSGPASAREAVEAEAGALPLPDLGRAVTVRWVD